jgi:NAD/NADP transhydrogenase alpha subunit
MLSKNISKLLTDITSDGVININFENEFIKNCVVTHEKQIVHEMTKKIIEGSSK